MRYSDIFEDRITSEVGLDDRIYSVPGIITATKSTWEVDNGDIPYSSGTFVWDGGIVDGHNIDMYPFYESEDYKYGNLNRATFTDDKSYSFKSERFSPFLNLNRVARVEISGLHIKNSYMFETREETPSLFTF